MIIIEIGCISYRSICVIKPFVNQKWAIYKHFHVFPKTSARVYYTDYPTENADFLSI